MTEEYFIITLGEDPAIRVTNKQGVSDFLKEEAEYFVMAKRSDIIRQPYVELEQLSNRFIIIKGHHVSPEPVKVVTEYKFE